MRRLLVPLAMLAAVACSLVPLLWMIETSLKPNAEITQDGTLFPHHPTLDNYRSLFSGREFARYLRNSVGITALSVMVALVLGTLAAYALARFRLWHRLEQRLGLFLLVARIMPPVVIVVPAYLILQQFGLLNTWTGLIVLYSALDVSFVVWMMESFFREIPVDLEEAALVDGDTRLSAFRRVILPLVAPGMAATAILAVILTYNEFLFALVVTSTPDAETMPVGAATLIGRINIDWGAMSAAGVVGAVPIVLFALVVQRHLVRGLTLGAVK